MGNNLSPQERATNFNQMTRRNFQTLGTKTGAESGSLSYDLPKSRLLAGLRLMVQATITATHSSSTSYTAHEDAPYKFLKRVEVSLNNGFSPYSISGVPLWIENVINHGGNGTSIMTPVATGRGKCVMPLVASSGGTANVVRFFVDLPMTVNPKDPIGLILLQNDETLATVNISLGVKEDIAPVSSGYTFAISDISVDLMSDTFSIPAVQAAFPDISVLKLVQERTETIVAGENIIKLPVGMTYRKLGVIIRNATPARVADSGITSTFDLLFNQADNPIRIKPAQLSSMNAAQYGDDLPTGVYVFDFSDNGLPNLGSSRDYIDTERMTEFWLKFTSGAAGTAQIFYEALSRLK